MEKHQRVLDPLGDPKDGHILTRAIIDTIHEPLIVLDDELRVIVASKSFYKKFHLSYENTRDKMFYDLGNGEWNIPTLRILLEKVIPGHAVVEGYEVQHEFPKLGHRIMLVNAREIKYENGRKKMLLSIFDVTEQRTLEIDREKLLKQKDLLLQEMRHRIANSLQLIASILLLKAGSVNSKESRSHLEDAHERIMSIATVQQHLDPIGIHEEIEVAGYLAQLCHSLARSMIGSRKPIAVEVSAGPGSVSSDTAVSFGLITTELVINAIKHAFPEDKEGKIAVSYVSNDRAWTLQVSDNGVGQVDKKHDRIGLGTSIIDALAEQLEATIHTESSTEGMKVSIVHAGS